MIEVETDDGVVGLGECADGDRSGDVLAMAPRVIGLALQDIAGARCDIALTEYFSYRLPGVTDRGKASPAEVADFCARMIADHVAVVLEVKVATVDLCYEVRAAIGDRALMLDANGVWAVPTARKAPAQLLPYGIA